MLLLNCKKPTLKFINKMINKSNGQIHIPHLDFTTIDRDIYI